jgi:hypothetical protein
MRISEVSFDGQVRMAGMSRTRVIAAVALGAFGLACLATTAYSYSEMNVDPRLSRLPRNYRQKMVVMELAPLAGGLALGAVVGMLTGYRRAWAVGFFSMLPLALYMTWFCLAFFMIRENH